MDPVKEGVNADTPPADADPVTPAPDPAPVSADVDPGQTDDRPLKNLKAEFDRKLGSVEQTLAVILASIQHQQAQQAPPQPARAGGLEQYTDEQLAQLAQSGSVDAQIALTERISARRIEAVQAQTRQTDETAGQLRYLYSRYPLHDPSSPLTQAAMRYKAVLMSRGRTSGPETDLEAIKAAIVDNPQLAVPAAPPAAPRRADATSQGQIDGTTTRRQPKPPQSTTKIDPKARAIAQRMGVDPEKAMERFNQRQEKGQSSVSPLVATIVREQS